MLGHYIVSFFSQEIINGLVVFGQVKEHLRVSISTTEFQNVMLELSRFKTYTSVKGLR